MFLVCRDFNECLFLWVELVGEFLKDGRIVEVCVMVFLRGRVVIFIYNIYRNFVKLGVGGESICLVYKFWFFNC